ncbi:MAG: aminotransferase class V-fold PLP-dependent enzyme [Hyphomicrobiales bacterium]|nr:aminotransferase class V-fold PLP-dependent enzyme [Hyphomicrobiales bacterium]
MDAEHPLIAQGAFHGLEGVTHLAAGGETPPLKSHRDAFERFMVDKASGMPGRTRFDETAARVRGKIAALANLGAGDVAYLANASEGLSLAAAQLNVGPGDNLVVAPADFPSVVLAACGLGARVVEPRSAGDGLVPSSEDYAAAIDDRTKAILVSHVGHLTGARQDLGALRRIADSVGARLIVDASHALGVVPVDGQLCDAIVSCCYKWLLGVHGCGIFCVNHQRWPTLMPRSAGWHSVIDTESPMSMAGHRFKAGIERFESGNPPFLALYILENGLDALAEIAPEARHRHCEILATRLLAGLSAIGIEVLTPHTPSRRAGNVSFAWPHPEALETDLRRHGVLVWAGEGRVRFSPYLYNDIDDIDRALNVLAEILAGGNR